MKTTFKDIFGKIIRLTEERCKHILERQEMVSQIDKISETLTTPNVIKISKYDPNVVLYYKAFEQTPVTKKFLVVITKTTQEDAFILTSFFTDKIKEGETLWPT